MTTNSDLREKATLYLAKVLPELVLEAIQSNDPDVTTAFENLIEVMDRSRTRARRANIECSD